VWVEHESWHHNAEPLSHAHNVWKPATTLGWSGVDVWNIKTALSVWKWTSLQVEFLKICLDSGTTFINIIRGPMRPDCRSLPRRSPDLLPDVTSRDLSSCQLEKFNVYQPRVICLFLTSPNSNTSRDFLKIVKMQSFRNTSMLYTLKI